jgi:hypothetical protein
MDIPWLLWQWGSACALPRLALLLRQFFDGHEVHPERIA